MVENKKKLIHHYLWWTIFVSPFVGSKVIETVTYSLPLCDDTTRTQWYVQYDTMSSDEITTIQPVIFPHGTSIW